MSDETETTGEVARVLAEASGCTWQRIPEPEHPYGRHCLKADLDEHPDVGYCWVQPRKQAAMLAEAGLLATGEHLAWERGYTWGINDEQNGTTTRNPYPAQIAASVPAEQPHTASGGSGSREGVGVASGSAYALGGQTGEETLRAIEENMPRFVAALEASGFVISLSGKPETNENEGA